MLEASFTNQFKKDYKLCIKRGCDMSLLQNIIDILIIPASLPTQNKDHDLKGNYRGKTPVYNFLIFLNPDKT